MEKMTENEYKSIRPEVEISVPEDFHERVRQTIKDYQAWLSGYDQVEEIANNSTDKEVQEQAEEKTKRMFRERYAGMVSKDDGMRLSSSAIRNIWNKFMREQYRDFLKAHVNVTLEDIVNVGIDKFIYTLGWKKPIDVKTWRNNKVRIGVCCHCKDQFIPMMFQYNHGLCRNCRPEYSHKAIRHFILNTLNHSNRYQEADQDLMMDFYIIFYHDKEFRELFMKGTTSATTLEALDVSVPKWLQAKKSMTIDHEPIVENDGTTDGKSS